MNVSCSFLVEGTIAITETNQTKKIHLAFQYKPEFNLFSYKWIPLTVSFFSSYIHN